MALLFGATGSDRVEVADSASLRNLTAATYLCWTYVTATTSSRFCQKGTSGSANYRQLGITTGVLTTQCFRATTPTNASATLTNFTAWGTDKWVFVAGAHDTGGVNSDQKLYVGDLTALAAEPSGYSTQLVGSGATGDNTGAIQYIAVTGTATLSLPGRIAVFQIYNRVLTLAEIQSLQFRPQSISGCVGYWILGNDATATQPDYSGNSNAGTVTGATVASHVPLRPAFGTDWYTINPPTQTITAAGITSEEKLGAVVTALSLAPVGIESTERAGTAQITFSVTPAGLRTEEALGTPSVTLNLSLRGVTSSEALGVASVALGINPTGVPSSEAIGSVAVRLSVVATGISSSEAVGLVAVSVLQTLAPVGIASSERFGTIAVSRVAPGVHTASDSALFTHAASDQALFVHAASDVG